MGRKFVCTTYYKGNQTEEELFSRMYNVGVIKNAWKFVQEALKKHTKNISN